MTTPRLNPPSAAALFAGGRAPACWRREVRRTTAAPAALARACAWVGELTREPRPRLRRQPLLGHCLADLLDAAPGEAPPAAPEPRPAKPPAARQTPGQGPTGDHGTTAAPPARRARPDAATAEHGPARRPHAAATAAGQPNRATPELLARLGGPPKGRPPAPNAHAGRRQAPGQRRPTADHRPPPADGVARDLSARLAERARQRARFPVAGQQTAREATPPARPAAPDTPAGDLAAQWRGSLAGQRAPAGWLAARRGPGGPAAPADRANAAGPRQSSAPDERQTTDAAGRPASAPARATTAQRGAGLRPVARPRRAAAPQTAHAAGHGSGAWPDPATNGTDAAAGPTVDEVAAWRDGRLEADDGQVVSVVSRFAPPQMADTLPPLRPPNGPALVAMPVAAAAARRSAQRETDAAVEDLDELAGKLRRLLEEESRRHGIDI